MIKIDTKNVKDEEMRTFFEPLVCTNVQVYPFKESRGKTKAFARIVLNDQLQLTGLRVIDGSNGFFVSYPIDPKNTSEEYHSIYHPINKELREHVERCILERYQEIVNI